MYFKVNLKMKKPALLFCMDSIEINFTVAFLLKRKTWEDRFAGKVGQGAGDFKKWEGILVMGGLTPLLLCPVYGPRKSIPNSVLKVNPAMVSFGKRLMSVSNVCFLAKDYFKNTDQSHFYH